MKKLLAALAITAAFASPVLAQSSDAPKPAARQHIMVQPSAQPLGPIQGEIGLATDPDPNVRLDLHRNFEHYANGVGG